MDEKRQEDSSSLFVVRIWLVPGATEQAGAWHGKVQHLLSGRAGSFTSQAGLMKFISDALGHGDAAEGSKN